MDKTPKGDLRPEDGAEPALRKPARARRRAPGSSAGALLTSWGSYFLKLKYATWSVLSFSRTVSFRQVFAHALSVFQT